MLAGTYIFFKNSILKNSNKKLKTSTSILICYTGAFIAGIISSLIWNWRWHNLCPYHGLNISNDNGKGTPTSQLILFITSLMGTFTYILLSKPDYLNALFLAAGAFIGGQIGVYTFKLYKRKDIAEIAIYLLNSSCN